MKFEKERIENLKTQICSVNELLKIKEELTKDRDEKLTEIVELRQSLVEAATKQVRFIFFNLCTFLFSVRQAHS